MLLGELTLCARILVINILKNNKLFPHKSKPTGFMVVAQNELKSTFYSL